MTDEEATLATVAEESKSSNWACFACYNMQDPSIPLKSALLVDRKEK
jgi:hypothetical protein